MKKARRLGALVIALAVFISTFAVAFADETQSTKYGQYISELAEKGIVKGYGNNSFGADDICTREQFITFLYRASGSPAVAEKSKAQPIAAAPIQNKQEIIAAACAVIAEEIGTDANNIKVVSFKKL